MSAAPLGSRDHASRSLSIALQLGLFLDVAIRLVVWSLALGITLYWGAHEGLLSRLPKLDPWDLQTAFKIGRWIVYLVIAFNLAYLGVLLVLRLPIPKPRPGRYTIPRPWLDRDFILACLLGALTRCRYHPPFPAFLVPQLASIQPFRWLFGLQFGPQTGSSFWDEPIVLEPWAVRIGRNVTIGHETILSGHLVERDAIFIGDCVIEDDVLIGGRTIMTPGCLVKRGAVIGLGSYLKPGTVVGENEVWAGIPAKKIGDVPPRSG